MSKSKQPTDTDDSPTVEELYERYGDEYDDVAEREDTIGAMARAVQRVAGGDD